MRKIIFFGAILALLYGCEESDNRNAKYVKAIEEKNNQLERDLWKKEALKNSDTTRSVDPNSKAANYFPFEISEYGGRFIIIVATESPELYPKYADFFEKYDYSGNGYCWEGHITQILEKINPALLKHVEFNPEAGQFFAYIDTKENQIKFVELLSPIFADMKKLEGYVKKADRSRVDD